MKIKINEAAFTESMIGVKADYDETTAIRRVVLAYLTALAEDAELPEVVARSVNEHGMNDVWNALNIEHRALLLVASKAAIRAVLGMQDE